MKIILLTSVRAIAALYVLWVNLLCNYLRLISRCVIFFIVTGEDFELKLVILTVSISHCLFFCWWAHNDFMTSPGARRQTKILEQWLNKLEWRPMSLLGKEHASLSLDIDTWGIRLYMAGLKSVCVFAIPVQLHERYFNAFKTAVLQTLVTKLLYIAVLWLPTIYHFLTETKIIRRTIRQLYCNPEFTFCTGVSP